MTTGIEIRKHVTSAVKALVIALAVAAGTSGSAMAASEEPSFTARAQVSQGLAGRDSMITYQKATIPGEAASFITRVLSSQGIAASRTMSSARAGSWGEAASFTTRAQLSQNVGSQQRRS
jgi:hypothetical protein